MSEYKLSATLRGHDDDVRSVVFPQPNAVISASRDATVRIWNLASSNPPSFDPTIAQQGSQFINVVAYIPPINDYPEGLIVSGGKDTIIEVRKPDRPPEENAERLLVGHSSNVCALDVSIDGDSPYVVSGGWDAQARIWDIAKWETTAVLEGHEGSVWAVLAYSKNTVITGCADKNIRIFTATGKLVRTISGSPEVIRALCKLPPKFKNGAEFASASNDAVIRLWNVQGQLLGQIRGHDSFIYSLAVTPGGDIVSSSEDRTVRVWRDQRCIQTITHPAISVWSVAVCSENGDIVSGASDKVIRVFTKDPERKASPEAIQEFEDSVASSSIPQQSVGDINKEKLPGPEFLQTKLGTKEGQVQMIRESNGNISAYQWSASMNQWINVGTVVDAVGSSGKKQAYAGQDYDYVFDVDIEDGKPPLKLPYNLSQNPYEAAKKFVSTNELPVSYLDQVANFIITNTQGATIVQTSSSQPSIPEPQSRPKVLPQKQYLSITTANLATITSKITQLNQQLLASGQKHIAFNEGDLAVLPAFTKALDAAIKALPTTTTTTTTTTISTSEDPNITKGTNLILKIITTWPPASRLPGLDLFRLLAATSPSPSTTHDLPAVLAASGALAPDANPNYTMLAVRALANAFAHPAGRAAMAARFDDVRAGVAPFCGAGTAASGAAAPPAATNRNVQIALATLFINYAVLAGADPGPDAEHQSAEPALTDARAATVLDDLLAFAEGKGVVDSEVVYRVLVGLGTLAGLARLEGALVLEGGGEQRRRERVLALVRRFLGAAKEPRIKAVGAEIRQLLGE